MNLEIQSKFRYRVLDSPAFVIRNLATLLADAANRAIAHHIRAMLEIFWEEYSNLRFRFTNSLYDVYRTRKSLVQSVNTIRHLFEHIHHIRPIVSSLIRGCIVLVSFELIIK